MLPSFPLPIPLHQHQQQHLRGTNSPTTRFSPLFDPGDIGSPIPPSARAIAELTKDVLGVDSAAWSPSALGNFDPQSLDADALLRELEVGSASVFTTDPAAQLPPPFDEANPTHHQQHHQHQQ